MKILKPEPEAKSTDLTDTNICAMLRSTDATERQRALTALFPLDSVVLIRLAVQETAITSTRIDPPRMFPAILYVAQMIGKGMGLVLNWVGDPNQQEKLIIPSGPGLMS